MMATPRVVMGARKIASLWRLAFPVPWSVPPARIFPPGPTAATTIATFGLKTLRIAINRVQVGYIPLAACLPQKLVVPVAVEFRGLVIVSALNVVMASFKVEKYATMATPSAVMVVQQIAPPSKFLVLRRLRLATPSLRAPLLTALRDQRAALRVTAAPRRPSHARTACGPRLPAVTRIARILLRKRATLLSRAHRLKALRAQ
jgi:hypothetical protein